MNEKIKELAEQSGAFYASGFDEVSSEFCLVDDMIETFAELIIKECINVISRNSDPFVPTPYSHAIKNNFGVEE
jgi:hypothetical protein